MNKIKIGLFFDGTGNNGYNAQSISKYDDSSYNSSPTNIFRLYKNYKNVCKKDSDKIAAYVEGIGTMNYQKDSLLNQAQGDFSAWSEYGAESKIKFATEYINRELVELFDRENIEKNIDLEFNIFGFSRGAALARHYTNQLSDIKSIVYENIKKSLNNNERILNTIKINFLGLYDTVESFGSFAGFNAITSVANLKNVGCIFQLRAEHECRENFPLTSILNNKQSEMVDKYRGYSERNLNNSKLIEVLVPGNHSDVGGSYLDSLKEDRSVEYRVSEANCRIKLKKIQENPIWTQLLDDKHIKYEQEFSGLWYWFAKSNRQEIRAQLQWIYAKLMIENAIKNNCEFDLNDFNREYDIPCDLKPIYSQLSRVIDELNDLKKCEELFQINRNTIDNITEKYIHISANWNYFTSDEGTPGTQPIKLDENLAEAQLSLDDARVYRPAKDWVRKIIFK
jgi:hypothetical protein